ncbi:MAG: prepilin-type N-terminal cleavage/methylation domain-containing protein [Deferribacteraceae bacterium]|jgi:prepilin-type N-terminal cleavage/methylation domain-containing protein|nr:prepilin-type N-terminal cleavage/methylation domain-containing protein [Deferribacteraceae bacterium]
MKKAFTLVELSIVLVVIGVIMGMAVKGRDLIETSKLRKEIRKLDKFAAAAAVSYSEERAIPVDFFDKSQKDGLLTFEDLQVDSYFNNSSNCQVYGCLWRFIRAVTVYDADNTTSTYRLPDDNETGDVLLAVATQKDDAAKNGYADSFVCKVEEYIDDRDFRRAMGLFFEPGSGLSINYTGSCDPSKNLLSGVNVPYGYKVF